MRSLKLSWRWKLTLFLGTLAVVSQLVFPGCASIMHGSTARLNVQTEPTQAKVYINGKLRGETPLDVPVSRWGFYKMRVEMPGYEPCEFWLGKKLAPVAGFNAVIGFAPIVIDVVTGAIWAVKVSERSEERLEALGFDTTSFGGGIFGENPSTTIIIKATKRAPRAGSRIATMKKRKV